MYGKRGLCSRVTRVPLATRSQVPDYVATVLPMLCSFARVRSAYPLVILAANLTAAEVQTLQEVGGALACRYTALTHHGS